MINWGAPGYLYCLFLVPVLAGLVLLLYRMRQRQLIRVIEPGLLSRIGAGRRGGVAIVRVVLLLVAITLFVVALARPRWGEKLQLFKTRGMAVVVALDASKSMLAEDVKPSRLARAKAELAALFDELAGNAVGVVAFAGDAYALCPLTTDIEAAKMFLDIISPDLMPVPGTDFGRAIEVASGLFHSGAAGRAIVLVTDGEDLGTRTEQAVQQATEMGIRIYPVAFATAEGAPIPERVEGGVVYKKDKAGNVIISRMDERKLILIAQLSGGRFYRVEGFSGTRLAEELNRLEKEELGGGSFSGYVERYQGFLLAGLVLFFLALVLPERRVGLRLPEWLRGIRKKVLGGASPGVALVLFTIALLVGVAQADVGALMRAGNSRYRQGKFEEALGFYQRAEVLQPDALKIHYNIGNTLYRLGRYEEALGELSLAAVDRNPARRAQALYNTGNTFYRMGRLDEAINAYKMALLANPQDRQAKENLEFCLKKKAEMEKQPDTTRQQMGGGGEQNRAQTQRPAPAGGGKQDKMTTGMDREQAERILQAIESKEKQTQEKARRARSRRQVEKDW